MPEFIQCVGRRRILVEPWQNETLFLHLYLKDKRLASLQLPLLEAERLVDQLLDVIERSHPTGIERIKNFSSNIMRRVLGK